MTFVIPRFEGQYDFLSNFHTSRMGFRTAGEDVTFKTAEAAFQACKYKSMTGDHEEQVNYVAHVAAAKTPGEAKGLGRAVNIDINHWNDIRIDVMRQVVRNKFDQNDFFIGLLLDTGPAMLVEGNNHGDTFWGRVDGKGYNMLGVILMELRGIYREKESK